MKKITLLSLMLVSFVAFAQFPLPYCGPIAFSTKVEPISLVNFAGINNSSSELIGVSDGITYFAHEDYTAITGNVTAGGTYTINIKGNTGGTYTNRFMVYADWNQDGDFGDSDESYTITQTIYNSTGLDATQATQSLFVPQSALVGTTRIRVKKIFGTTSYTDPCVGTAYGQVEDYSVTVAPLPTDLPDYVNLQFPYTSTFNQGGNITVYGRVYEAGLTDTTSGQAPGINAWIGISPINSDTNPDTWTNWIPATFNVETSGFNNTNPNSDDEYQAIIGAALLPGSYYYATRFQLNGGAFVYGGTNNGFWDGITYLSGTLTVNPPITPVNDECSNAITLTCGSNLPNQNTLAATGATASSCLGTIGNDIWYKFIGTGELIKVTANASADFPQVEIFESNDGTCTGFTTGTGTCFASGGTGLASVTVSFSSTLGTTYFIRVGSYINTNPPTNFTLTLNCISPPDYVNLQNPSTATIIQGGSVLVSGEIYEMGLTDTTSGQAPGVLAWIGISPTGSNTNPNTWTNWIPATFNSEVGNNDKYQAAIGSSLASGTYYYATRFQLNGGDFVYGGINTSDNGNFWDGTIYLSGVLTVSPPTCISPTGILFSNITNISATVSWTASVTTAANGYEYYLSTSNSAPTNATVPSGSVGSGITTADLTLLNMATTYYFWVRSVCSNTDSSAWSSTVSFATPCTPSSVPYTQDFETAVSPALPSCTSVENAGTGNTWAVINNPGNGFTTKVLRYVYNDTDAANAWFYTNGITLTVGTQYYLTYKYGNNSTTYVEKMKVAVGTSPSVAAMTGNDLADHPTISGGVPTSNTINFSPSTSGVYYFGFNAYSIANQFNLYLDDVSVTDILGTSNFDETNFNFYPNPVKNILNLSYNQNISCVEVINLLGQKVILNKINSNTAQIDMSTLSKGAYMVRVTSNDQVKIIKVIKE